MSAYENVVGGKLKLKGKPLDVKAANIKKKKKNKHKYNTTTTTTLSLLSDSSSSQLSASGDLLSQGGSMETLTDPSQEDINGANKSGEGNASYIDNLTPAERRYMEQRQKIDIHKLAKTANKSHRDRISDFNQYLANMSEHYDIPKVGPG